MYLNKKTFSQNYYWQYYVKIKIQDHRIIWTVKEKEKVINIDYLQYKFKTPMCMVYNILLSAI